MPVEVIANLYNDGPKLSNTLNQLGATMHTINKAPILGQIFNGTTNQNGYNGMGEYISSNTTYLGSDYADTPTWRWMMVNIGHDIPLCLNADVHGFENDSRYGGHSFFAIGYQDTSTGQYIRVINEWDTSKSHFYNYSLYNDQISFAWYYRF